MNTKIKEGERDKINCDTYEWELLFCHFRTIARKNFSVIVGGVVETMKLHFFIVVVLFGFPCNKKKPYGSKTREMNESR